MQQAAAGLEKLARLAVSQDGCDGDPLGSGFTVPARLGGRKLQELAEALRHMLKLKEEGNQCVTLLLCVALCRQYQL